MKTNVLKRLCLAVSAAMLFAACQKEVDFQDLAGGPNPGPGGGNTGTITGDYNFIGLSSKQINSITTTESGMELKVVAATEYASEDNSGSLKITDNQFVFTGIGHTVKGTAHLKGYLNGVLFEESNEPFDEVTPPTDNTYDYVRNNADSITFTNAMLMLPDASGNISGLPGGPMGARISLLNDTLSVAVKISFTASQNQGGIPIVLAADVEGIMKFKKK